MKKLLITGFEPFGGELINPSWEAVSRLCDEIGEYLVTKLLIPVEFGVGAQKVIDFSENLQPDAIICVGQAGGRNAITPEFVGINLRNGSIPDNAGVKPQDEPIVKGGDKAYFSTIPARKIAEAIQKSGVNSHISYSAGAYVCNDVLYTLLRHYENTQTMVGFIHIPYCTEQGKEPCMPLDDIIKGLTIAIESIDD